MGSEPLHIMAEPLCPDLSWSQDQPQGWDPPPPANVGSKVCASQSTMPPAQGRESKHPWGAAGGGKCGICRVGMRPEWDQSLDPCKEPGEERQTQTHSSWCHKAKQWQHTPLKARFVTCWLDGCLHSYFGHPGIFKLWNCSIPSWPQGYCSKVVWDWAVSF